MERRVAILVALATVATWVALAACGSNSSAPSAGADTDATAGDGAGGPSPIDSAGDAPPAAGDGSAEAGDGSRDAGDASPTDDLGPLGLFCASYAKAVCDRQTFCTGQADPACPSSTLASCREYARAGVVQAMDAGLLAFDAAKAVTCFATPMSDTCSSNDLLGLRECLGILTGTVPNGGACFQVYFFGAIDECATGGCSVGETFGTCTPGRCVPRFDAGAACIGDAGIPLSPGCGPDTICLGDYCAPELSPGQSCPVVGSVCRRGYPLLWCLPSVDGGSGNVCDFARDGGSNCNAGGINESIACRSLYCVHGICADRTPDGSLVCQPAEPPCPSGTLCSPGTATLPTSCQPPLAAGGPCDPPGTCVAGYWCAQHGDAAACDPLPAANAPCSGPCAAGLTCSRFQDAGACQTVVTDGGACRGLHDDTCAPGLVCVTTTNVCAPPAALGAACASDFDCQLGLYCDSPSQACRTWKRHGDSCTRDGECVYNGPCDAGHCNSVCIVP